MKKLFWILLLASITNKVFCQTLLSNTQIEYVATTRGFYKKIWIQDNKIAISTNRNDTVMPNLSVIGNNDLKILAAAIKKIKLADLDKYAAPTKLRFHCGAAIADLKIIANGTTYQTQEFDNGYAPKKIKILVDKIVDLAKKKK